MKNLNSRTRACRASWNYLSQTGGAHHQLQLTYWMSMLQHLDDREVFVTLNPAREPQSILRDLSYRHPLFTLQTLAATRALKDMQGADNLWLAGAYLGNGFHEDGLRSGEHAARRIARADAALTQAV